MYKVVVGFDGKSLDGEYSTYVREPQRFTHSTLLEIVWTVIPAIILILIAVPSFALLYSLDEILDPQITLKIVGHQWYWSYEYSDNYTNKGSGSIITQQIETASSNPSNTGGIGSPSSGLGGLMELIRFVSLGVA